MSVTQYNELSRSIQTALETYSNVHRGSGHYSQTTTVLYEQARTIVLEYLGLNPKQYLVIFSSPRGAEQITAKLTIGTFKILSSADLGLPIGVRAIAVKKNALPKQVHFRTGGGTARLVARDWIIWAKGSDQFEAGTPAIINIITFAKALLLSKSGNLSSDIQNNVEISNLDQYSGQQLLIELRKTLIGKQQQVPTTDGIKTFINFDNGASTSTFTPIWNTVLDTWQQPLTKYPEMIQKSRAICANVLGAPLSNYEIIFTANTTESINLVAESVSKKSETEKIHILNTLMEHNSNELPWRTSPGFTLQHLPISPEGLIDLAELENTLRACNQEQKNSAQKINLVAISGASNVLGTCNDLAAISAITHKYGAQLLVDAAQLIAHRPINIEALQIDYLAFSAHKAYAPFGTGVLIAKKGLLNFTEAEHGHIKTCGEENVSGIAALGTSLELLHRIGFNLIQNEEHTLIAYLVDKLSKIPELTVFGFNDPKNPDFTHKSGVAIFQIENLMAGRVARELAEKGGIGVRYGCHCAHILIKNLLKISPGLERFQGIIVTLFPRVALPGLTRISLGLQNTTVEIDVLVQTLTEIIHYSKEKRNVTDIKKHMVDFTTHISKQVYSTSI